MPIVFFGYLPQKKNFLEKGWMKKKLNDTIPYETIFNLF